MITEEILGRDALQARQGEGLRQLLRAVYGPNPFYTRKLDEAGVHPDALDLPGDLARLPFTTKAELVLDQQATPPWGTNLTEPQAAYTRYCQTSSTTGRPLRWMDTGLGSALRLNSKASSGSPRCEAPRLTRRTVAGTSRARPRRAASSSALVVKPLRPSCRPGVR